MKPIHVHFLMLIAMFLARLLTFPGAMDLSVDLLWVAAICVTILSSPRTAFLGLVSAEIILIGWIGPMADLTVFGARAWLLEGLALFGMSISIAITAHLKHRQPIGFFQGILLLLMLLTGCIYAFGCRSEHPFLGVYLAGACIVLFLTATHARRAPVVWTLLIGWTSAYIPWIGTLWIIDIDLNAAGSPCLYAQRYLLIPLTIHLLGILLGGSIITIIRRQTGEQSNRNQ